MFVNLNGFFVFMTERFIKQNKNKKIKTYIEFNGKIQFIKIKKFPINIRPIIG